MAWRRVGYDKVALRGREVGPVETKSMARRVEVRMGDGRLPLVGWTPKLLLLSLCC